MQPVGYVNFGDHYQFGDEQGLMTRSRQRMRIYSKLVKRARAVCKQIWRKWSSGFEIRTSVEHTAFQDLVYKPVHDFVMREGSPSKLIIVFDEAANLGDDLLYSIRRLMMAFSKLPVWSIFLSSSNQITKLYHPPRDSDDRPVRDGLLIRCPTLSGLELDLDRKSVV